MYKVIIVSRYITYYTQKQFSIKYIFCPFCVWFELAIIINLFQVHVEQYWFSTNVQFNGMIYTYANVFFSMQTIVLDISWIYVEQIIEEWLSIAN